MLRVKYISPVVTLTGAPTFVAGAGADPVSGHEGVPLFSKWGGNRPRRRRAPVPRK